MRPYYLYAPTHFSQLSYFFPVWSAIVAQVMIFKPCFQCICSSPTSCLDLQTFQVNRWSL